MKSSRVARNICVDGDPYVSGFLGLSLFPSAGAKRNAFNYEAVLDYMLLQLYAKFTSSRVIVNIARHASKQVVVRPRNIPNPDSNTFESDEDRINRLYNAEASPTSPKDATYKGAPFPAPGKEPWEDKTTGTGQGSDVVITFNPGVYPDAMGQAPAQIPALQRSDYGLLHELVHALSDVSGTKATTMGGPSGYDNLEEFTAIVISNVYISEVSQGASALVGGHGGQRMPLLLTGGQAFYNRYRDYMQQVCRNHRALAMQLSAGTGISHNPFAYCTF